MAAGLPPMPIAGGPIGHPPPPPSIPPLPEFRSPRRFLFRLRLRPVPSTSWPSPSPSPPSSPFACSSPLPSCSPRASPSPPSALSPTGDTLSPSAFSSLAFCASATGFASVGAGTGGAMPLIVIPFSFAVRRKLRTVSRSFLFSCNMSWVTSGCIQMGQEALSRRRGSTALCETFVWQQGSITASMIREPSFSAHCSSFGMLPSAGTCTLVPPTPIALSKSALCSGNTTNSLVSVCLYPAPTTHPTTISALVRVCHSPQTSR